MHAQTAQDLLSLLSESLLSLLHNIVVPNIGYQRVIIHFVSFFSKIWTGSLPLAWLLPREFYVEVVVVNFVSFLKVVNTKSNLHCTGNG